MTGQSVDLDQLFDNARTYNGFEDREVSDALLRRLHDLFKWGPTAANSNPGRFLFVKSPEAKERLLPCMNETNRDKVRAAPVTVVIAWDSEFYELMPKLFPGRDYVSVFKGKEALIADLARRSAVLQGAYMMIAARALGLDCGPMSGFDMAKVNAEFFPEGRWHAEFVCNLGYGREDSVFPRNPRPDFEEACLII